MQADDAGLQGHAWEGSLCELDSVGGAHLHPQPRLAATGEGAVEARRTAQHARRVTHQGTTFRAGFEGSTPWLPARDSRGARRATALLETHTVSFCTLAAALPVNWLPRSVKEIVPLLLNAAVTAAVASVTPLVLNVLPITRNWTDVDCGRQIKQGAADLGRCGIPSRLG